MEISISKETLKAYQEKAVDWIYDEAGDDSRYVDGELYLFSRLSKIISAIEVVERTTEEIFSKGLVGVEVPKRIREMQVKIISAILVSPSEIERHVGFFKINPKILAWVRVRGSIEIVARYSICDLYTEESFERIDTFLNCLRKELSDPDVKKASKSLERASNKNHKSLTGYIDSLFLFYSRLLVVRMDFGYKKFMRIDYSDPDNVPSDLHSCYSEINANREELIGYMRGAKKEYSMVGYAWKLEYGAAKGYHYHVIFFLDGSKVRQDISIAQRIGEFWNEEITKGDGTNFICNLNKDYYKMCGVGMISHSEIVKINNLKRASVYLTKVDRIIHVCTPGRARCFGKGETPRKLKSVGRPRRMLA